MREGGVGYDVMGYTREQLIEDIVDHFESHLQFLHLSREMGANTLPEPGTDGGSQ